jgi:NAD+ synthase (glutamine-hydrolysing)
MIRVAAVTPEVRVANVPENVRGIKETFFRAREAQAQIVLYPELCITGYTCADLFYESTLLQATEQALVELAELTLNTDGVMIVGAPLASRGQLYNCAVVIGQGALLGVVPKTYLPSYQEFYEARWFASAGDTEQSTIRIGGNEIPFGTNLLFEHRQSPLATATGVCFGVEVCEDLWATRSPSTDMALAGAQVLFNLSASNEVVGKAAYRRDLVRMQSARCIAAYVYCSAGSGESSTDVVFAGHNLICEHGELLAQSERFLFDAQITCADIDIESLDNDRIRNTTFRAELSSHSFERIPVFLHDEETSSVLRPVSSSPFLSADAKERSHVCAETLRLQSTALVQRMRHVNSTNVVLGLSGGLDSTLALYVCLQAVRAAGGSAQNITAISMPGFGTGSTSRALARTLAEHSGVNFREIDITAATRQHFADISHNPDHHNVVFENAQARERTQVLMDVANQCGAFVIGTGDLSEIALGWNTFNGDHMSMYAVNCGVPKTVVRAMVEWLRDCESSDELRGALSAVLTQPISPELLPTNADGESTQQTESVIGPYELHDFFLYHVLRHHFSPAKILHLAAVAFGTTYTQDQIAGWLRVFYTRFFANQYKRSAMPDGPKVLPIGLSPRGDWRMPSDASCNIWMSRLSGE